MAPRCPRVGAVHSIKYRQAPGFVLNELGRNELSSMPKIKPTTGPMRTQPMARCLDSDDTNDAHGRKGDEGATTRANTNKDGSSSHREGETLSLIHI